MTLWVLAMFKAGRREAYFRQELFVRSSDLGRKNLPKANTECDIQGQNCVSNTAKCEINRKAGTSIVFTFCTEYFGCYDVVLKRQKRKISSR